MPTASSPDAPVARRERLLRAALDAFGQESYDAVSVSSIADRAGVAHGLPFHYFGSKRGLFVAMVESLAVDLRAVHTVPDALGPNQAVRQLLQQHIEYFESRPHTLLDLMRGGLGADPEVRAAFDSARWDGAEQLLGILHIDPAHRVVRVLVRGWMASTDELISQWLVSHPFSQQRLIDLVYDGLVQALSSAQAIDATAVQ